MLAETQEVGDRQRHPRFLTVSIMTIGIDEIRETYQEHELDTITMISFWNLVAEDVLERMDELIATYQVVSVADFYDLVGVSGNYTDNKYGWTDIRNASVIRVRDGYMIKLPKALPLN